MDNDQVVIEAVTDKLLGEHRRWIEQFAINSYRSYDAIMAAAKAYLDTGEVVDTFDEFDDEFWTHYEIVTARRIPEQERGSFFVCCAATGGG